MRSLKRAIFLLRERGKRALGSFSTTDLVSYAFDLLFPDGCIVCGRPSSHKLCRECRDYLNGLISISKCTRCGEPFWGRTRSHLCPSCEKEKNPVFTKLFFSFPYTDRTKDPLLKFKYGGDMSVLSLMREFFPELPEVDVVVPVPLHVDRLRKRGFNQSALIAREVSCKTGFKLCLDGAFRVKPTRSLTGLSLKERSSEIKGAFSAKPGAFRGMKVLLVDDVYTTGATLRELSRVVLRVGGAEEVFLYTLFRTY